jgi:membrane-bound lytic murein transglycosylase D
MSEVQSTSISGSGWSRVAALLLMLLMLAPPCLAGIPTIADSGTFSVPPELEPDVRFWIRVYTEVTTDGGLIHDSWYLGLVYEVLRFEPDESLAQREREVAAAKARYAALLRRFADGDTASLTRHERRILHAFGAEATRQQFLDAIDRIRFQLGQANRFQEGLIRSQLWESHIARTLQERGVPAEIAALPHVESSFNPAAYSRVGAAGLWQFMPATARRFMRVDNLVDERLDPYRATEAAANLMLYNYNLLGTWPLAVTAYNHGPGGLRRAQEELGTNDIGVIVKRFQGATFGFASRNFYVAFLAALEVDRNAGTFFGPLTRLPDTQNTTVELPDYIPVDALAKAFNADPGALRVLNPALRPPIWDGERFVPRGYGLRLPGNLPPAEIAAGWARLPLSARYLAQCGDARYRVRHAESLGAVAARLRIPVARLLAANGWSEAPELQRGQVLRLPPPPTRADGTAGPAVLADANRAPPQSTVADTPAAVPQHRSREPIAPRPAGEALLPAATPTANTDTTDYGVEAGDAIVVRADETLGHIADWSGVGIEALRLRNHLRKGSSVGLGHRIRLDLSRVGADRFVAARTAYHRKLQDEFFATHRIAGTDAVAVRHGDSLWTLAQQHGDLPLWLITQYNPDVDFSAMQPGTQVTLPRIEPINRQ